jgi:hypothetical protein
MNTPEKSSKIDFPERSHKPPEREHQPSGLSPAPGTFRPAKQQRIKFRNAGLLAIQGVYFP